MTTRRLDSDVSLPTGTVTLIEKEIALHSLRTRFTVVVAAIAVLLVACGGDDDSGPAEAVTELQIQMDSFFFDPSDVTVAADTPIDITALNLDASLQHNWVIVEPGSEIEDESEFDESKYLFQTAEVEPQTSATGTFTVAPGEYQIICTVPGHFSAGMVGTLTSVSDA